MRIEFSSLFACLRLRCNWVISICAYRLSLKMGTFRGASCSTNAALGANDTLRVTSCVNIVDCTLGLGSSDTLSGVSCTTTAGCTLGSDAFSDRGEHGSDLHLYWTCSCECCIGIIRVRTYLTPTTLVLLRQTNNPFHLIKATMMTIDAMINGRSCFNDTIPLIRSTSLHVYMLLIN